MDLSKLPSFDLVVPPTATDRDATTLAVMALKSEFGMRNFDILKVECTEVGDIETPKGSVEGKRYVIVYRNNLPH